MPIRFLAIDIDGTLLDSQGQIPPRNREAIAAALDAGVEVALVTGRAFHFARPVAERLGLPVLFVVSNGALIKTAAGIAVRRRLLPASVARSVLDMTDHWRADVALIFDRPAEAQVVSEHMDWQHPSRVAYWRRNQAVIHRVAPLAVCLDEDPIQVMFNGGVDRMRSLASLLRGGADAAGYHVTLTEYAQRDFSMVDVLAAGVSKGRTITSWAAERGFARDELMAVGDNYNDIEMLAAVGCPVVMGNAVPELLVAGYATTASNDEAGLALAIEEYILARESNIPQGDQQTQS
jgi:Cof subfamily protein (haloacid dehalogenase superfamily)